MLAHDLFSATHFFYFLNNLSWYYVWDNSLLYITCTDLFTFSDFTWCSFSLAYFTMLFEFMYIHWCPTRFPYHMMFVSFFSNTAGASRRAGAVYAFWVPPFIVVVLCFLDHLYVFFLLAFVWFVLYGFWAPLWYLQTFLLALTFRFPLLSRHIFTTLLVCLQTLIFTSFL